MNKHWMVSALLLLACQKEEERKSATAEVSASAFLNATDIKIGSKPEELSLADARIKIEGDDDFYHNKPDSAKKDEDKSDDQSDDDFDACIADEIGKLPFKVGASSIALEAKLDMKVCMQKMLDSSTPGLTVSESTIQFAFAYGCENGDFSAFNGKTYTDEVSDEASESICSKATTVSKLLNMKMSLSASGKVQGVDFSMKVASYTAAGTAAMKACTYRMVDGLVTSDSGCLDVSRSLTIEQKVNGQPMQSEGSENFKELAYQDIQASTGAKWYKAGKINVTLNNWTGVVTYTGNDTAPTYELKNGSSSITGSLSLTDTAPPSSHHALTAGPVQAFQKRLAEELRKIASRLPGQAN